MPPKPKKTKKATANAKAIASNRTNVVVNVVAPRRAKVARRAKVVAPDPTRPLNTRASPLSTMSPYQIPFVPSGLDGIRAEVANLRGDVQRASRIESYTIPSGPPPSTVQVIEQLHDMNLNQESRIKPVETPVAPEVIAVQKEVASSGGVSSKRPISREKTNERFKPYEKPTMSMRDRIFKKTRAPYDRESPDAKPTKPAKPAKPAKAPTMDATVLGKRARVVPPTGSEKRQQGIARLGKPFAIVPPERYNRVTATAYKRQEEYGRDYDTLNNIRTGKKRIIIKDVMKPKVIKQIKDKGN